MGDNPASIHLINRFTTLFLLARDQINLRLKEFLLNIQRLVATRNNTVFVNKGFIPVAVGQNQLFLFFRTTFDLLRSHEVATQSLKAGQILIRVKASVSRNRQ